MLKKLHRRVIEHISKCESRVQQAEATAPTGRASEELPTEESISLLVWKHVERILGASGVEQRLPPPASARALMDLDLAIRDRFGRPTPSLLAALLRVHNGLAFDTPSAFLAAEQITEWIDVLQDVDKTLLLISVSQTGDGAVLRLAPEPDSASSVYAYWHEDYEARGVDLLAPNLAEYLILVSESFVETETGLYRGPTELPPL